MVDINDNKKVDIWYKFYQNLKLYYNITKKEFKEFNFIFVGEFNPHVDDEEDDLDIRVGERLLPFYFEYFSKPPSEYLNEETLFNLEHRFIYKNECICEVKIKKNCFIYSKSKDILLNIGSECCDNFNENKKYKSCQMCSIIHHNSKNNFCKECRTKIYLNCVKCKVDKSKFTYYLQDKLCYKCKYPNFISNTKFDICSICKKSKKEDTFVHCYECNMKKKMYRK